MRKEIRVTGFGGQGIILTGFVMGKAATVFDGQFATLIQSYGPEARGSACAAQVVVSDEKILYPYLKKQEILLALSQEGYDTFVDRTDPDGVVLYDTDLVEVTKTPKVKIFLDVPATVMAEEMGRRMVANIVMLGFFTGVTGVVSVEAMQEAVRSTVPKGTEELNLKALDMGLQHAAKSKTKPQPA
jgi:2-oxoglutarate ferredoxin oxidoreductase subunit gamma